MSWLSDLLAPLPARRLPVARPVALPVVYPMALPTDWWVPICASLRDRWWEWQLGVTERGRSKFSHASGVWVAADFDETVWCAVAGAAASPILDDSAGGALAAAMRANMGARVSRAPFHYPDAARALATALLAGAPPEAVYGMVDEILEHVQRPGA